MPLVYVPDNQFPQDPNNKRRDIRTTNQRGIDTRFIPQSVGGYRPSKMDPRNRDKMLSKMYGDDTYVPSIVPDPSRMRDPKKEAAEREPLRKERIRQIELQQAWDKAHPEEAKARKEREEWERHATPEQKRQATLDAWHKAHPGPIKNMKAYRAFLEKIGYLVKDPGKVKCTTAHVDAELAVQAGPQLVVPILNARYALNAANARWGSLYDALYGTDAISEEGGAEKGKGYNPVRGAKVIAFARQVLDQAAPLATGSHKDATGYSVVGGKLVVAMANGSTGLADASKFVGYQGDAAAPSSVR